jgi:vancomycin resistance protein VanJ
LRLAAIGLGVAYPLALLAVLAVLRGIGERWPLATIALYLPHVGWGLPLPLLTLALFFVRPRWWLLSQALAALLLLFPLMGLELRGARAPTPGATRLRVLSYNVDRGALSADALTSAIRGADADVVCLQEATGGEVAPLARALPGYAVRGDGQFVFASRFPIVDVYLPPRIPHAGQTHDANFVRYRVAAPGGLVDVYNVHPVSPHGAFDRLRGGGLLHELASGRFLRNDEAFRRLRLNAALRELQAGAAARHAAASPYPVLLAGDTNLPTGSPIFARTLAGYQDGFTEAGRGFGYTFPARKRPPWLRLDRILADDSFRFVTFSRLDVHVSTHFPIVADIERRPTRNTLKSAARPSIARGEEINW